MTTITPLRQLSSSVLQRRTGNNSSPGVGSARLAIASEDIEDESNPGRTGSLKVPEISSQSSIPSPDQVSLHSTARFQKATV